MGHYVVREEGECGWLGRMNVRLGGEGVCWGWVGECVSVEVGWGRVNGCQLFFCCCFSGSCYLNGSLFIIHVSV